MWLMERWRGCAATDWLACLSFSFRAFQFALSAPSLPTLREMRAKDGAPFVSVLPKKSKVRVI
jgi:hypothetical protein